MYAQIIQKTKAIDEALYGIDSFSCFLYFFAFFSPLYYVRIFLILFVQVCALSGFLLI